ncbi:hypothetical protein AB0D49_38305 [Streptomyces sp. NPDC048290]|uniref:hypothetical protein n=1 Tax=Streptomyces sp. NPDC048290 TaxID=3155811 RepID=UPI0034423435
MSARQSAPLGGPLWGPLWGPPPWLWLTWALCLVQTKVLVDWVVWFVAEDFRITPVLSVVLAMTVVLAVPALVGLAGALALLAPRARARRVERRYRLMAPERMAGPGSAELARVVGEIRDFLAARAPRTELRVSLLRELPARVYPGGFRTARVAVFAPLLGLWARDRPAAEAILLHEAGHLGHAEQHVAGLGSPLVGLVKAWPYLLLGFGVVPAGLLLAAGPLPSGMPSAQVLLMLAVVPKTLLVLVSALWTAELTADRYAVRAVGQDVQLRALGALGGRGGSWTARLHHPPLRLRRWFVARSGRPGAQALLMLLWPAAMAVESAADLLVAVAGYRLLGETPAEAARTALALAHDTLLTGPTWWATLALLALWPPLAGRWSRLWGWRGPTAGTFRPAVYAVAVLPPVLALLLGLLTVRPEADPVAPPAASAAPPSAGREGLPSPCPSPSRPAPPVRPEGLPVFAAPPGAGPAPAATAARTFRGLRATAVRPLAGTSAQAARDTAARLLRLRWTLAADATLTTDDPGLPALRPTAAYGEVLLLRGEHTGTTEVSATTTWTEARLTLPDGGGTARLELIRAATGVTHAVVACQVFDSTVTTAARLTLELGEG